MPASLWTERLPLALLLPVAFLLGCSQVQFQGSQQSASPPGSSTTPTSPTSPTTPVTTTATTRNVTKTVTVDYSQNKVDILMVVDDSNSMLQNNQKLAARMANFISALETSTIDWQMCVTVTRQLSINSTMYWGASIDWVNYTPTNGSPTWLLKKGTTNLQDIFSATIDKIGAGWAGTEDERGIKSMYWHMQNAPYNYCYRDNAAIAVVQISNEDERSIGGVKADQYYPNEYFALEDDDLPETLTSMVKSQFGGDKRFTVNSIIVQTDDAACMATQDAQGTKSHYGRHHQALSQMTAGGLGSICDADYSSNLQYFENAIETSLASTPLECAPVNGTVNVTITPAVGNMTATVQGMSVSFSPQVPAGSTITLDYQCTVTPTTNNATRTPSSVAQDWMQAFTETMSPLIEFGDKLFHSITGFVKSLFLNGKT